MRSLYLCSIVLLGLLVIAGCDKGDGGGEPETVTMVSHTLAHEGTMSSYNFTIQAPEAATVEWSNPSFLIMAEDYFKVRVTPGEYREWPVIREAEIGTMANAETLIDEDNTLMYQMSFGEDVEINVLHMVALGDATVLCQSIGPVGSQYTREQVDRILESCRSLALPE